MIGIIHKFVWFSWLLPRVILDIMANKGYKISIG